MLKRSFRKIAVYSLLATLLSLAVYLIPGNLTDTAYATSSVTTYAQPTGVDASEKFSIRIYDGSNWQDSFTYITGGDLYWSAQEDHTNSFTSFEFSGGPVTVEVTAEEETTITSYRISPASLGIEPTVSGNTLTFILVEPTQLVVEINDSTVDVASVFANAPLEDVPLTTDSDVYVVEPGETAPTTGTWTTLYFAPGVHDIGKSFPVYSDKNYYIAGGAVVKGTFTNIDDYTDITYSSNTTSAAGQYHAISNTKIWGYGIISGEDYPWTDDDPEDFPNRPLSLAFDFDEIVVEGVTFMDSALHTMGFWGDTSYDGDVTVKNVKVITWKRNGDACAIKGDGLIEDCFFMVSDDGPYIYNTVIKNCIIWNQDIGNAFVFSGLDDALIEDCQIIYFAQNTGSDVAVFRDKFTANYDNRVFRNIRIENNDPTEPIFLLTSDAATNVLFENIYVENTPTTWSMIKGITASQKLENWSFSDIYFGGTNEMTMMQLANVSEVTFTSSSEYSFSDNFGSAQGTYGWYYMYDDSGYKTLLWNSDRWVKPDMNNQYPGIIACDLYDGMIPGDSNDVVLKWVAAEDGTINIEGTVSKYESGGNGVQVKILQNSTQVWPSSGWQDIAYDDLTGVSHDFDVNVETGDEIYFIVSSNGSNSYDWTLWDPTITYQ